ncbi:phospholipase D-like domain-containing protein [Filimonas effusa]|uniref:phospholipase D n=1 Tax=Filimonas effusa TaxID=2508721 RepID=A0A4Q1DAC2_9BACT|nr:phospholipase D-like domain-containing protein [Filimonas effusa]RXK85715.1 hypothetical protein ESB13_02550 [Filimonas effusa]
METIDQKVINDNKEIYACIQSELYKATFEILLATAWFTDEDLFNILLGKLAEGVRVEVIIADNQENEKLDFGLLVSKGAFVYKIKNSGYGIMNQKFCVIDQRIALHGSYNWSVNAKKNNHESIISTNHSETIRSLIENFHEIKNRILEQNGEPVSKPTIAVSRAELPKGIPVDVSAKAGMEFEQVLDTMIAAEIRNFDRKLLREHGFSRCNANNGDHQVLYKAFDTLYYVFINDIDVVEDKKTRLVAKIEEQRIKSQDNITRNSEIQIDFLERAHVIGKTNLEVSRTNQETELEVTSKSIEKIRQDKIPVLEEKNYQLDKQIKEKEGAILRPKFKWFEFIPTMLFGIVLVFYIFLFYSSGAYILLFSAQDAAEQQLQNIPVAATQIFDSKALHKAFERGGTTPMFILAFPLLLIILSVIDQYARSRWSKLGKAALTVLILFADAVIAYQVTQTIYEINYSRGTVNVPWKFQMVFADPHFYLVFVFGAAGLFLFKVVFKKFISIFEERNPDNITLSNRLAVKHLQEELNSNLEKIAILKEEVAVLEKHSIQLKAEIKHIDLELSNLPQSLNQDLQKRKQQLIQASATIDRIAAIYTTRVQSDNIRISLDALKDRINIFLEGWNDLLFQEYAVSKASLKASQAAQVATEWQDEKLASNVIDKRVKINQDA